MGCLVNVKVGKYIESILWKSFNSRLKSLIYFIYGVNQTFEAGENLVRV